MLWRSWPDVNSYRRDGAGLVAPVADNFNAFGAKLGGVSATTRRNLATALPQLVLQANSVYAAVQQVVLLLSEDFVFHDANTINYAVYMVGQPDDLLPTLKLVLDNGNSLISSCQPQDNWISTTVAPSAGFLCRVGISVPQAWFAFDASMGPLGTSVSLLLSGQANTPSAQWLSFGASAMQVGGLSCSQPI